MWRLHHQRRLGIIGPAGHSVASPAAGKPGLQGNLDKLCPRQHLCCSHICSCHSTCLVLRPTLPALVLTGVRCLQAATLVLLGRTCRGPAAEVAAAVVAGGNALLCMAQCDTGAQEDAAATCNCAGVRLTLTLFTYPTTIMCTVCLSFIKPCIVGSLSLQILPDEHLNNDGLTFKSYSSVSFCCRWWVSHGVV